MKFVMFDIEALGPPGVGDIFAIGAVRFDPDSGRILDRFHRNVRPGAGINSPVRCIHETLSWVLSQGPQVLAQLRDPEAKPFAPSYLEFMGWLDLENTIAGPLMLLADDWSDFAWIESEAHRAGLPSLRQPGVEMYDVSVFARVESPRILARERALYRHIALDDAEAAAIDFADRWPIIADRWVYPL